MKPCLLPSLCVVVLLLSLAGCSSYEPKILTGAKPTVTRTREEITKEILKTIDGIEGEARTVKDAATAKAAATKVTELFDHLKTLGAESLSVQRTLSADENQQFDARYQDRVDQSKKSMMAAIADAKKIPGLPPELGRSFSTGSQIVQQWEAEEQAQAAAPPPPAAAFAADSIPDNSCWAVWLLCLLVLAVCIAFLCRDGVWSNAVRLVNVIFAG
ncbi:MAG: hypothetical protein ABSG53_33700, partial [Thermoguttaceae bacterium]